MNAGVQRQKLRLQDFEPQALEEIIRGAALEQHILSNVPCNVKHDRWEADLISVDRGNYSFPVRVLGQFSTNRIVFGHTRRLSEPSWVNGFEFGTTDFQFYPCGTEINYRAGCGAEFIAVSFPEDSLQSAAVETVGRELELPRHVVNIRGPAKLRREFDRLATRSMRPDVDAEALTRPLLRLIVGILTSQNPDMLSRSIRGQLKRDQIVKRIDRHLRSEVGRPFNLGALSKAVGLNARSVQEYWKEALGVTPGYWARCLALHRAHTLIREGATVKDAALTCGFSHLGRFSGYYRDLFGELPSFSPRNHI
ncbi:helix-turn-helix domain-containing protein [Haloferula sp.]|uniref:AraC family transcriptional regulator n=1 Tax=Haloferula sp. TaxID=2497595 RepID=UPI00329C08BB